MAKRTKLQDAIEEFLKRSSLERQYSQHSFRAKKVDLQRLASAFNSPHEIQPESWAKFCSKLRTDLKPASIERAFSTYRNFFRFCDEDLEFSHFQKIEFPRIRKSQRLPKVVSYDEVLELLRDQGIVGNLIEFLYATGARISEACQLRWKDIDWKRKSILLQGKGRKERSIPLSDFLAKRLKEQSIQSKEYVFPSLRDESKALNPRQARRMIRDFCIKNNFIKHIHPHLFRHSIATHMLDEGADLRFIQEFLGHSSLSTTQKYLKVTKQRLMEVYDKCHPRA